MKKNKEQSAKSEDYQAVKYAMRWYGWGSPIGASIFLLAITFAIAFIKIIFFG